MVSSSSSASVSANNKSRLYVLHTRRVKGNQSVKKRGVTKPFRLGLLTAKNALSIWFSGFCLWYVAESLRGLMTENQPRLIELSHVARFEARRPHVQPQHAPRRHGIISADLPLFYPTAKATNTSLMAVQRTSRILDTLLWVRPFSSYGFLRVHKHTTTNCRDPSSLLIDSSARHRNW